MSDARNNLKILLQIVDKIQLEIKFSNGIDRFWVWTEKDKYNNIRYYITNSTTEHKKQISDAVMKEILSFFDADELDKNLATASMHITSSVFRERYIYDCLNSKNIASFYETVVLKYQKI